eukprot:1244045-Pyramimonas_sp.AAC.1
MVAHAAEQLRQRTTKPATTMVTMSWTMTVAPCVDPSTREGAEKARATHALPGVSTWYLTHAPVGCEPGR